MFGLLLALSIDPCALLPEKDVREIFEIASNTPVRVVKSDSCTYVWLGPLPSLAELRLALRDGKKRPSRDNESVSLRIEPNPQALRELDARFEKLTKGFSVDRGGDVREVKPQTVEWVAGLGEKAYWNASLRQLVIARKDSLLSVVIQRPSLRPADLSNLARTVAQSALRKQ
ncbi:MAG: hypothetical protein FJW30_16355 [Acidobacteria bacterium]|nr:hypothetical protein [Acidobacteriota bacterium]